MKTKTKIDSWVQVFEQSRTLRWSRFFSVFIFCVCPNLNDKRNIFVLKGECLLIAYNFFLSFKFVYFGDHVNDYALWRIYCVVLCFNEIIGKCMWDVSSQKRLKRFKFKIPRNIPNKLFFINKKKHKKQQSNENELENIFI